MQFELVLTKGNVHDYCPFQVLKVRVPTHAAPDAGVPNSLPKSTNAWIYASSLV